MNVQPIYDEQLEELRLSKIQKVCMKTDLRQRKIYTPQRSLLLAEKVLKKMLDVNPVQFTVNDFSLESTKSPNVNKEVLTQMVALLNNIKEDFILSITAYTDSVGTAKDNLILSQRRADRLKAYFLKRTALPFIVAIGYGEAFPLENRHIEFKLTRIKQ